MPRADTGPSPSQLAAAGDPASWDSCVRLLIGPRGIGEPDGPQKRRALELAAAALRFAGRHAMAGEVLGAATEGAIERTTQKREPS